MGGEVEWGRGARVGAAQHPHARLLFPPPAAAPTASAHRPPQRPPTPAPPPHLAVRKGAQHKDERLARQVGAAHPVLRGHNRLGRVAEPHAVRVCGAGAERKGWEWDGGGWVGVQAAATPNPAAASAPLLPTPGCPGSGRTRGEVLGDGPLDHLKQLVGPVGGPDRQLLQQLHHQAAEAAERARQAHLRAAAQAQGRGGVGWWAQGRRCACRGQQRRRRPPPQHHCSYWVAAPWLRAHSLSLSPAG